LTQRHSTRGAWLITLASLIVMAICVYDYYTPETGLIGTGGVVLVAIAGLPRHGAQRCELMAEPWVSEPGGTRREFAGRAKLSFDAVPIRV